VGGTNYIQGKPVRLSPDAIVYDGMIIPQTHALGNTIGIHIRTNIQKQSV
jgi:hypothetical protein